jgi:hypothetical protein
MNTSCCSAEEACVNDSSCEAVFSCYSGCNGDTTCQSNCLSSPPSTFTAFINCFSSSCESACQ